MFPTVATWYPREAEEPDSAKPRTVKMRYFDRKPAALDTDLDRTSIALSRKSSEDVTKIFSSLSTVFDFADFAATQGKVSSDNEVFVNLIQRVRQDVTEASRLYASHPVQDYLESWPDKKIWIDNILHDNQRALNDIGLFMDTVHVSGDDGGTVARKRKFEWILSHHKRLISKQQYLMLCHQSLMATVQVMLAAEMNATFAGQDPVHEAPARPWLRTGESNVLRSPYSRQRLRSNSKNHSVPSITVSNAELNKVDDSEAQSVNSVPFELPGSMPEDLPDPENWDLYAPPPEPRSLSMSAAPSHQSVAPPSTKPEVNKKATKPERLQAEDRQQAQPSITPLLGRRSFDSVRPPKPALHSRARPSLDQIRPRAFADQIRQQVPIENHPRASFDQVKPMPTVSEKPLERFDSTASVSVADAATMPLSSMRFRPKAVNVEKTLPKHSSLPSELPYFPSQTSLMDDLSHWVIPDSARESYQSYHDTDTTESLGPSTSSTSSTSSPVITSSPTSSPTMLRGARAFVGSPVAETTMASTARLPIAYTFSNAHVPILPSRPPPLVPNTSTQTKNPTPSTLPLRAASEPVPRSQQPGVPAPFTRKRLPALTAQKLESNDPTLRPVDIVQPDLSNSLEVLPQSVPDAEDLQASPTSLTKLKRSEPLPVEPVKSVIPDATARPITAQAKRRAAHARRMQLAFDTE